MESCVVCQKKTNIFTNIVSFIKLDDIIGQFYFQEEELEKLSI
jgi:hypothetical protein